MTIGMWVILIIIGICGFGFAGFLLYVGNEERSKIISIFGVGVAILTILSIVACVWWFNNSASGARWKKDFKSNIDGGIERTIVVYDVQGKPIEKYHGKFDIDENTGESGFRIKFDDENGERHIVYCTTGTVIVTEER